MFLASVASVAWVAYYVTYRLDDGMYMFVLDATTYSPCLSQDFSCSERVASLADVWRAQCCHYMCYTAASC